MYSSWSSVSHSCLAGSYFKNILFFKSVKFQKVLLFVEYGFSMFYCQLILTSDDPKNKLYASFPHQYFLLCMHNVIVIHVFPFTFMQGIQINLLSQTVNSISIIVIKEMQIVTFQVTFKLWHFNSACMPSQKLKVLPNTESNIATVDCCINIKECLIKFSNSKNKNKNVLMKFVLTTKQHKKQPHLPSHPFTSCCGFSFPFFLYIQIIN